MEPGRRGPVGWHEELQATLCVTAELGLGIDAHQQVGLMQQLCRCRLDTDQGEGSPPQDKQMGDIVDGQEAQFHHLVRHGEFEGSEGLRLGGARQRGSGRVGAGRGGCTGGGVGSLGGACPAHPT